MLPVNNTQDTTSRRRIQKFPRIHFHRTNKKAAQFMNRPVSTTTHRTLLSTIIYPLSTLLIGFLLARIGFAQSAASVTTDQSDYPPGSTVYITGTGFGTNEIVTNQVLHIPDTGDNNTSLAHQPRTVTA